MHPRSQIIDYFLTAHPTADRIRPLVSPGATRFPVRTRCENGGSVRAAEPVPRLRPRRYTRASARQAGRAPGELRRGRLGASSA